MEQSQAHQDTIYVEDESLRLGFTQIPNAVLRRPTLSAGAKLTYMGLLSYAWKAGSCFPGQNTLAIDLGVSRRSVIIYLHQLQEVGLLRIRRRGLGKTNIYTLTRITAAEQSSRRGRSAESAHQEVKNPTHQEVHNLHSKKTQGNEDSNDKDTDSSSKRTRSKESERRTSDQGSGQSAYNPTGGRPPGPASVADILAGRERSSARAASERARKAASPRSGRGGALRAKTGRISHPRGHSVDAGKPSRRRDRLPAAPQIRHAIAEYSELFGDGENVRSNVTRALRLYVASGLPEEALVSALYQARSITRQQRGVRKRSRMPYFFAVVVDLLGLRSERKAAP